MQYQKKNLLQARKLVCGDTGVNSAGSRRSETPFPGYREHAASCRHDTLQRSDAQRNSLLYNLITVALMEVYCTVHIYICLYSKKDFIIGAKLELWFPCVLIFIQACLVLHLKITFRLKQEYILTACNSVWLLHWLEVMLFQNTVNSLSNRCLLLQIVPLKQSLQFHSILKFDGFRSTWDLSNNPKKLILGVYL